MGEDNLLALDEIFKGQLIRLAPHRALQVGTYVAVLARDSTGWALLSENDYWTVKTRLGQLALEYDTLWPSEKTVVHHLWDNSLITLNEGVTAASLSRQASPSATYPNSLLLKLTGACNFSCSYCYDFDEIRFRKDLSTARAQETIEYLLSKQHNIAIAFHGGEPLLRFQAIREIVDYAKTVAGDPKRLSFSIQTNASRMTNEVVDFLEHNNFSVGISIDGHIEEANRLRVVRSGPSALSYVQNLLQARPDFIRKRCGFLMVVGRTSAPYLLDFAKWLQDNDLKSLGFSFLDNEGAGKHLDYERLTPQEVVGVWESMISAVRTGTIKKLALTALLSRIRNMFTLAPRDFCHRGPCGAASEFLVLDATGQFRTCDCVYDPYFEAGDNVTPVRQLINILRPAQDRITNRHNWLSAHGLNCKECSLFGLCGATCVAKAIAAVGSPNDVDPGDCAVSKYIYPLLLEEFAATEQPILSYFAYHQTLTRNSADAIS